MRTITAQLEREDLPEMWEVALYTIEQKHPEYKEADVEFWELPPRGTYSYFREPDDATCFVSGHDQKTYAQLPTMKVVVENADIASEDGDGSYQGYLVTIDPKYPGKDLDEYYAIITEWDQRHRNMTGQFVDLKRVESPKLDPVKILQKAVFASVEAA